MRLLPGNRLQDIYYLAERGNPIYMDDKKLLRYSMQLSMLKQLLSKKLISENEYQIIQKKLMKDYGIYLTLPLDETSVLHYNIINTTIGTQKEEDENGS